MHRIDNPTASVSLPTPKPAGPEGYFTAGNPNTGQLATIVEYDWLNSIQEELCGIVARGGLTDDKTDNSQVLQALANLFDTPWIQIKVTQNLLVPEWATQIAFELVGGGGSGGHCQNSGNGNYEAGGGGGSGAYAQAQRAVTPGQLVNVIIGTGATTSETNGTSSSVAFLSDWTVTCDGGVGATWSAANNSAGGIGGDASGGDMNVRGNFGGDGQNAGGFSATGYGGAGPWGGASRAAGRPPAGWGSTYGGGGPGAGGGGAYDNTVADGTFFPGSNGANGVLLYRFLP